MVTACPSRTLAYSVMVVNKTVLGNGRQLKKSTNLILPSIMSVYFELRGYSMGGGTLLSSKFRGCTKQALAERTYNIHYTMPLMSPFWC